MNRLVSPDLEWRMMKLPLLGLLTLTLCLFDFTTLFSADTKSPLLSIDFFWAKDCPHCEGVKDLIHLLQRDYNIKLNSVDVETETGYKAFTSMARKFHRTFPAVPLIVVGGEALMGQAEIKDNLENKIKSLMVSDRTSQRTAKSGKKRDTSQHGKVAPKKPQQSSSGSEPQRGRMRVTTDE